MKILIKPALLFASLTSGVVLAEGSPASESQLEEIVVHASFYGTSLDDMSASISVFDESTIADRGAQHLDQLLNMAPNVNYAGGASRGRFIQVRGIGDLEQFTDPKHYPSVGLTIDGIDMSGLGAAGVLYDAEQVEVLRGPQGTRFGASALAGMINIQTADPSTANEAEISTGIADYDGWQLGGKLSGALTDSLAGRLVYHRYKSDGYIDNEYLGRDNTNDFDEQTVRTKLTWAATDNSRLDFTALYVNIDNGYDVFSLDNSDYETQSDEPGFDKQETLALALKHSWQLNEELVLETSLSGKQVDLDYGFDEDWTHSPICDLGFFCNRDRYRRDRDEYNLDIRLLSQGEFVEKGDSRWVAGIYSHQRDEDLHRQQHGDWATNFESAYDTDRNAVYGQFEYRLADNWELAAGLRWERFEDDYSDTNGTRTDSGDDLWGGDLSLTWLLEDGNRLYALLARGYKPGGVNTEANSSYGWLGAPFQMHMQSRLNFDAEEAVNMELGYKGKYLDGRLTVSAALFYIDRQDPQLETWLYDAGSFTWVGYLDNADEGTNQGVELELYYQLNSRLGFFANLGYLDTEVEGLTVFDLDLNAFKSLDGRDQGRSANYQYNVGVDASLTEQLTLRLEVEGRDDYYFAYYHDSKADSYNLLNASLNYRAAKWEVHLWGRNLLDEEYQVHGLYFAADPRDGYSVNRLYQQLGEPRVIGLTTSYRF
jgi:outer membrane receptor protein involved in Fe transport